jgi:hypothetical protein
MVSGVIQVVVKLKEYAQEKTSQEAAAEFNNLRKEKNGKEIINRICAP